MRLSISKSKNTVLFYIIESTYINKKHSTKIIEKLGNLEEVKIKAKGMDPYEWAKRYAKNLTLNEKQNRRKIIKEYAQNKLLPKDITNKFNIGYLFLQSIYYKLKLNKICDDISNRYQFKYDLNDILSKMIYARILFPASTKKTLELSKHFLEQPNFEYQHMERALQVLTKENDFIQTQLYKNSCEYNKRNNRVLYYDCTNFYFEIEQEDNLRKYGKSKENRPNPIVQMGLFMDGDGIPLSCEITPGNQNEQTTLKPLEEKIIKDFDFKELIVCTDAGLSSKANRKFNNTSNRKFITTQSIKKLKDFLNGWALDLTHGWKLPNSEKTYNIEKLRYDNSLINRFRNATFYKERWINEDGIEQRLIVTYSVKYQEYQKHIRNNHIERARKLIEKNPSNLGKVKQNDPKRFVSSIQTTDQGEVATECYYSINVQAIENEAKYDGLYAVCTNLEDTPEEIIRVNHRRWEIEESFRIMKNEFNARPVYHFGEDEIKAHFLICYLSLVIYRYLEKYLDDKFTVCEIIDTLKEMEIVNKDNDFIPIYTPSILTDELHKKFNFRTDYEIISNKNFKKICNSTKK